jgi:hypothetical protein
MTSHGSITEAFVKWLTHFSHYKVAGSCLLVFDRAISHLDHSTVEAAHCHDITLFSLPNQTTHELQPTDKSVFGPLGHYWDEKVQLLYSHSTNHTLTKQIYGNIFTEAWDKAAKPANIKAGFHATGIYPFNPSIIPDKEFAPSLVTRNEGTQVSHLVTVFETPAAAPLPRKTHKASAVPGTSSRDSASISNPDVICAGRNVADMRRNAIITPSK